MKKTLLIAFALALTVPWAARAQSLETYSFSTGTDSSLWVDMTGSTQILTPSGSDGLASQLQDIGFIFPFGEDTYTQFSVNTDGNLRLGSTVTGTGAYSTPFSATNANTNNPKINAFGCDGYGVANIHYVKKLQMGDTLLVVEFCTGTFNSTARNNLYKWQVHLHSNGNLVMVYPGASQQPAANPPVTRQCGLCVASTDGWTISATHEATHFTNGVTTSANIASGNWPDANRYYRFTRPTITCPAPANVALTTLTATMASLSWIEMGEATTWEVVIDGGDIHDVLTASITPAITFPNLDANTDYTATVRAVCGMGDTSLARTFSFRTPCLPVVSADLPYTYGFEDATASGTSGQFSPCWGRYREGNTTAYPYPYATSHSGSYGLYLYGTSSVRSWTTLPLFEDDLQDLYLTFWAYKTSASGGSFMVGVMTDPSDMSTFDTLQSISVSATSTWEYYEVPLEAYSGTGLYLAFLSNGSITIIDDITVTTPPSCMGPSLVEASDLTGTSATLSFTGSTASQFLMLVNASGSAVVDTVEVAGSTYTMTDLTPGTTYEVRAYSLCSGDTSMSFYSMSFTTECDVMQLPVVFDAEGVWGGTAAAPQRNCWDFVNGGNSSYNWRYNTAAANVHGGSLTYYYYGTTTSTYVFDDWMLTPVINFTGNDEITLWAKTGSATTTANYHGHFALYANDADSASSTDTASFALLDIDSPDATDNVVDFVGNTWRMITIKLPATLIGEHRLAFVVDRPTYTFYIDDINIHEVNSCVMPYDPQVTAYDAYTATFEWSDSTSATDFEVLYYRLGSTDTATISVANDTTATITGLLPNTVYYVMVRTVCSGGSLSELTYPATFRTACAPVEVASLPYVEDFESYTSGTSNTISPCWKTVSLGTTTNYVYPINRGTNGSGMGLRVSAYNSSATAHYTGYAVLPVFDTALNALQVEFDVKRYSSYNSGNPSGSGPQYSYDTRVQVGIIANPDDTSTFTVLRDIDLTSDALNAEHHYTISLEAWDGAGRIAFLAPLPATTYHYNYVDIDNVTVSLLPDCRQPVALQLDSAYVDALEVSWVSAGVEFELQCSRDRSFDSIAASTTVYNTSGSLTGLDIYKNYYVRVRSVCGDTVSTWSDYAVFHTAPDCSDQHLNDTIGTGTVSNYAHAFYSYTNGTSRYATGFGSSIFTAEEMATMGVLQNTTINGIALHSGSQGGTIRGVKVYMAETTLDGFSSSPAGDTVVRDSMSLVFSGDLEVPAESWVTIPFDSVFAYGGGNLLVSLYRDSVAAATVSFYYTSTTPNYLSVYGYRTSATVANNYAYRTLNRTDMAFDMCTETPTCVRPAIVTVDSYSDTSVTLSWGDVASMYEVAISTTSGDPDELMSDVVTTTTSDNHIVLGELQQNTTYYVHVRSHCGTIGSSEWSLEQTFRTACAAMTLPYAEGFEGYGSGAAYPISPCWHKGTNNTTAYPYPYSSNAISGSTSLYFYAFHSSTTEYYSYAVLPMFQDSVKNLSLRMNVRRHATTTAAYTSRLVVGVMTDPDDITTFEPLDTIDLRNEMSLSVHGYEYLFNNYQGNGSYIALYDEVPPLYSTTNYSYIYVDDIYVDYIPTCPRVTGVTFSGEGTSKATVSWDAIDGVTGYEVEYGPRGFNQGMGTVVSTTDDSLTLNGLAPSTTYDVYVRALCSASESGEWSFVQSFQTMCGLTSLPIVMTFDNEASGNSSPLPSCWTRWNNNPTGTYSYYPYIYNSSSNAHSGTNCLYAYMPTTSSYPSDFIVSSPAIDTTEVTMDNVVVTFWAKRSTNAASLVVGTTSDPDNAATFVAVDTIDLTNTYAEYTVEFAGLIGLGNHVALRGTRTGTQAIYYYIDDITIEAASPCGRAYDLYVTDATQNSVTVGWSDTVGSASWRLRYCEMGSTDWVTTTVSTNPYTLTGLDPQTGYRFQVAPVCATGEVAAWSREEYEFFTSQVPATMPYSYDFEDAAEWANWQFASNNATGWARGNIVPGNSTYVAHLSTDGGTTYSWMPTSATNAAMYRDIDFGATPHSVTVNFTAVEGGRTDGNYDGISVMLVDPSTPVVSSSTYLESPWGRILWVHAHNDTVWTAKETTFDGVTGIKRLVFIHYSNSHSQPYIDIPSAIDNVVVTFDVCDAPYGLVASNVTSNSIELDWEGDDTTVYIVDYRPAGTTGTDLFVGTVGTHATLTNMLASTSYNVWVRKVCDTADSVVSNWSDYITVTTLCGYEALPYSEDFESVTGVTYSGANGTLPNCWKAFTNGSNANYTPHVTGSGSYHYPHGGSNALTMLSSSSTTYGTNKVVALPPFGVPLNTLNMSFWYRTQSATNGTLTVGYVTNIDDLEGTFVAVATMPNSTTHLHDTVSFADVTAPTGLLAFRWSNPSTLGSVGIDDIDVWSEFNACAAPTAEVTDITHESAVVTATGSGIAYEMAYGTDPANMGTATVTTSGVFSLAGLAPVTTYYYKVRAICGTEDSSAWVNGNFTTTAIPDDNCTTPTGVGVSDVSYTTATVAWTADAGQGSWELQLVLGNGATETYTVTANPYTLTDLVPGTAYTVMVRALCSEVTVSEWSDGTYFATNGCQPVATVSVSEVTSGSAMVSWNATAGSNFEVEYGAAGFTHGNGQVLLVDNATSVAIEGLAPETTYDVYVRSNCAEGVSSAWSNVATFTTATVGIDNVDGAAISLYPNPATTTVVLEGIMGQATVTIVDMNGRTLRSVNTAATDGTTSANDASAVTIDLTGLAQGAYFVRITGDRQSAVRKLIVK